jgi:predicted NUDIX family NTP pyrophosphohydrolase
MVRTSAGILLYRFRDGGLEVLLAHPGGPYQAKSDAASWSIPKGEPSAGEDLEVAARREFEEETGHPVGDVELLELGSIRQRGGKIVYAWAAAGDLDPATATCNTFELEWPPRSGRMARFPEIDRVAWFEPGEARRRIKQTQIPLLERLEASLDAAWMERSAPAAEQAG